MAALRSILVCTLLAAGTALLVFATLLVRTATAVVASVPGQIEAARRDLTSRVDVALATAGAGLDRQAGGLRADLTGQVAGIRADLRPRVDALIERTDSRVGEALQVADSRLGEATGAVAGIRADLAPTLRNSAALTASIPPDDVAGVVRDSRFFLARAARTAGHIEQASDRIEAAVPPAIATWQSIGANVNGISANVNALTKPKWYDRAIGYGLAAGSAYRDLNPGYNVGQGIRGLFVRQK